MVPIVLILLCAVLYIVVTRSELREHSSKMQPGLAALWKERPPACFAAAGLCANPPHSVRVAAAPTATSFDCDCCACSPRARKLMELPTIDRKQQDLTQWQVELASFVSHAFPALPPSEATGRVIGVTAGRNRRAPR